MRTVKRSNLRRAAILKSIKGKCTCCLDYKLQETLRMNSEVLAGGCCDKSVVSFPSFQLVFYDHDVGGTVGGCGDGSKEKFCTF